MGRLDRSGGASKGKFAILLSKNVQTCEKVATDCTRMGLKCVPIASEDDALEWLWAHGRQLRVVILDEEFSLRDGDSFPGALARDWGGISVVKLSAWNESPKLRSAGRKA